MHNAKNINKKKLNESRGLTSAFPIYDKFRAAGVAPAYTFAPYTRLTGYARISPACGPTSRAGHLSSLQSHQSRSQDAGGVCRQSLCYHPFTNLPSPFRALRRGILSSTHSFPAEWWQSCVHICRAADAAYSREGMSI